ncbi:MAG TPA: carboxypeptidase-like regulatory domain-containing protein [Kofleriaceae bacterium]|nr:carboxypeptidase-like regulatory domain-containing protein [Kofleriaceae bacterium]
MGVVVVVAAIAAYWMWGRGEHRDTPATASATQRASGSAHSMTASSPGDAPATLAVTVRDGKGPIANATVRIAPDDGDVLVVQTAGNGVATTKLAPGTYAISASAPDHEPAAADEQTLASGASARVELVLAGGGRLLTGTVTDVSGGPIAGARIDGAKLDGFARPDDAIASTLTDAAGKYRLTVSEGHVLVAARSADYAPQSRYVEVGPAGATADFALVPGGVIEGVVLDEQTRQPVGGAIVEARRDSPMMLLAEEGGHLATANADGRFRLSGLRPGAYELAASAQTRRSKQETIVGLGVAEQVTDVQLLVGTGPVIRGKVVDDANAPVAGAHVRTFGRRTRVEATSDAQGNFVLEGLQAGQYAVFASGELVLPGAPTAVELATKDIDGVIVHVQRGFKIKGHVEPRQRAEIEIDLARRGEQLMPAMLAPTATNDQGEFELGPVVAGDATLTARCASGDQGAAEVKLAPGMPEVVLHVTPGGSIAGRILDGQGKAVAGASVMASRTDADERTTIVNGMVTSGVQAVAGLDGKYEIKGLSAGTYRLAALDRGRPLRMRSKPPSVKLAAAEKKTGIDLAVDRANGVIRGVVTGPDGKPLADAWVSVQQDLESLVQGVAGHAGPDDDDDDGGPPRSRTVMVQATDAGGEGDGGGVGALAPVLTDAQGKFEITGLAHATYDVVAEAQAGQLRGRANHVTPDATLTIQALGLTTLSGTARGAKGPAALFTVELDGPTRAVRTFTDGTFSLGRVDPGSYTLRVSSSDGNAETKVTVAPNKPTTVDVVLVANAVVVGAIVDPSGKPAAGVPVTVIADTGDGRMQISLEGPPPTSGPDGKFRIEHAAGPVMVVVMTPPRPVTKRGLTLEPGKTLDVGTLQLAAPAP